LYKWVPEISSWREALFSGHFGEWNSVFKGLADLKNIFKDLYVIFAS
jgi:hypothetical protein